ncbi:HNH endonuclease [Vibrio tritonius]|uniref:HNH endonuclease n=1 Tax=Vibrio tritonius TaxID=1435069 RepID=UPI0008381598|nr:HNH endonuclease [Vibrio tritonius]
MSSDISDIRLLASSILSEENVWDWENQRELASLKTPDILLGIRKDIIQGDITREWLRWIIEQFVDYSHIGTNCTIVKVYSDIYSCIDKLIGLQENDDYKINISKQLSKLVLSRMEKLNKSSRRKSISNEVKRDLIDIYSSGDSLRCWLTGYEFSPEAIFNFDAPKSERVNLKLPEFVDRLKPIGLNESDLRIEVDHLYPFSLGGKDDIDNYRLICGWANRVKSNHITAYSPGNRLNQNSGFWPRSYYYWLLRLIGLRRKCEYPGCKNNLGNSELTVESIFGPTKNITPASMRVVCREHSVLPNRYIKREDFDKNTFGSYFSNGELTL